MNVRSLFTIVAALTLVVARFAFASCPSVLYDSVLISDPIEGKWGRVITASPGSQDSYVITTANGSPGNAIAGYLFDTADHDYVTMVSPNIASGDIQSPSVAPVPNGTSFLWAFAWEGFTPPSYDYHSLFRRVGPQFQEIDSSEHIPFDVEDDYLPWVAGFPTLNRFAVTAMAYPFGSLTARPALRYFNSSGSAVAGYQFLDDLNQGRTAVSAFNTGTYGQIAAVAWVRNCNMRWAIYNSSGTRIGSIRESVAPTGYCYSDVAIAGYSTGVVLTARRSGSSGEEIVFRTFNLSGQGTSPITAISDPTMGGYFPTVVARTWQGNQYFVISWLTGNMFYSYPSFALFRGATNPVNLTGEQYLSFFPSTLVPDWSLREGVGVELFTGCSQSLVVGAVYLSNADISPSFELGVRRSFVSVSGASAVTAELPGTANPWAALEELHVFAPNMESDSMD